MWANELSAAEVLSATERHFPKILASMAKRDAAVGQALTAEGAFDLVFSVDGYSRASGYYDGRVLSGEARQELGRGGASVYGKYRISGGSFPIYEDEYFTNTAGEFKIGVLFSLLRNRGIDQRRFNRADAAFGVQAADLDVLLTKLGVQRLALIAYWRWVTAGRQIPIYQELLNNAQIRETALEKQVRSGARARIFLTENRQNIIRRESLVTIAQRDLSKAANALSFYYRGIDGSPVFPAQDRLPADSETNSPVNLSLIQRANLAQARASRPELEILNTQIQQTLKRIELAQNDLKPRLDVEFGLARDIGAIAEGGPTREGTDAVVGLEFSVPLQRRAAKGKLQENRAKLRVQREQQRELEDQIDIEVRNIVLELNAAAKLAGLAQQEVGQALALRDAERIRFDSGASDFFLVNVREQAAADAQRRYLYAVLEARIARTNYDAAVVDLERLGLAN